MTFDLTITTAAILGLPPAAATSAVAQDFLKRVLGPIGDEIGKTAAEPIQKWREKRVQRARGTLEAAATLLNNAGKTSTEVPGRVLIPLLEAASLEEDAELRQMWATLLANAANASRRSDLLPSFIWILRELSPIEARVLSALRSQDSGAERIDYSPDGCIGARFNPPSIKIISSDGAEMLLELPFRNYRVVADNLMRLRLVEPQLGGEFQVGGHGRVSVSRDYGELALTPLGHHLVESCRTLSE